MKTKREGLNKMAINKSSKWKSRRRAKVKTNVKIKGLPWKDERYDEMVART